MGVQVTGGNFRAEIAERVHATTTMETQVISNFAWQHLKAAAIFRDRLIEIEGKYLGQQVSGLFEEIRSYASASVMSATASLEALINELFITAHYCLRPMIGDFEADFWGRNGIERKPILAKYALALTMVKAPPLDTRSQTYRDVEALISFRNALVHYKPTWDLDRNEKIELVKALRGRYPLSPFGVEGSDFLTMQSMSSGCASWAVRTVLAFLRDFDSRHRFSDDKLLSFWMLET